MTRRAADDVCGMGNVPRLELMSVSKAFDGVPAVTDVSLAAADKIQTGAVCTTRQNVKLFKRS
jgi:hypothetical protein